MTEAEWSVCQTVKPMLALLRSSPGNRKLRLFACACTRRIFDLLPEGPARLLVELTERYVDGLCDREAVEACENAFLEASGVLTAEGRALTEAESAALRTAETCTSNRVWDTAEWAASEAVEARSLVVLRAVYRRKKKDCHSLARVAYKNAQQAEDASQCMVLRDVFGNPFRRVVVNAGWLAWDSETVLGIAQGIYEESAFERLPILADALEDAGCEDANILEHCRGGGPHVRGCWVVDLLLRKT